MIHCSVFPIMWLLELLQWLIWRPIKALVVWLRGKLYGIQHGFLVIPYQRHFGYTPHTPFRKILGELRRQEQSTMHDRINATLERIEPKIKEILTGNVDETEENQEAIQAFLNGQPFPERDIERVIRQRVPTEEFREIKSQVRMVLEKLRSISDARFTYQALASVSLKREHPLHTQILDRIWSRAIEIQAIPTSGQDSPRKLDKGRDWSSLGFQRAECPESDLRSVGMLGLIQFWNLLRVRPEIAKEIIEKTDIPHKGYPLALLSLKVTHWLVQKPQEKYVNERLVQAQSFNTHRRTGRAPTTPKEVVEEEGRYFSLPWIVELVGSGEQATTQPPVEVENALPESVKLLNSLHVSTIEGFDSTWEQACPQSLAEFEQVWTRYVSSLQGRAGS